MTSARVCKHMNEDHGASCLAFAWQFSSTSATEAEMTDIDGKGFDLKCVVGGSAISTHVPFDPPLSSDSEMRGRLVAMHELALAPRIRYLLSPLSSIPLILIAVLAVTLWKHDLNAATSAIDALGVSLIGSRKHMIILFWVAVAIHMIEASLAARCALNLKLSKFLAAAWFFITILGGNGTLCRIQALERKQALPRPKSE